MKVNVIWEPQPGPQTALLACPKFEVFFGGARGGGKTDGMLGEWISHQDRYGEHSNAIMFRRERTQLVDTIERSRQIFGPLGATFHEQEKLWRFPNGSRFQFAYLDRDSDADGYQGRSHTRVYIEEIGTFPNPSPIFKLMATLRSGHGIPCGFRATGNPGGPGHQWVRARYIDPAPLGWRTISETYTNPWTAEVVRRERIYIPSKLADNRYLGADYVANLQMVGNQQLVRAWLEGDWSVIEGAFFPEFSEARHVIPPFEIPSGWLRFRSADWGSARPFSIGWWAVVGDDHRISIGIHGSIPRGSLVRYREWYGASAPNTGLKLTAEEVADGIVSRETAEPQGINGERSITYGVLDPAAFSSDGGPSIAERMARSGVFFRRADNARVSSRGAMGGWDQLRARLVGDGERPMIYFTSNCRDSIRTLPALQHDRNKPEDVDCLIAGTMVDTPNGIRAIETIQNGELVHTPIGIRAVVKSYISGVSPTVCIKFEGGELEGTPHHKIYVVGKGLICLENLCCDDMLMLRNMAWQAKLLSIGASLTHDMRAAITTIRMELFSRMAVRAYIGKYGWMQVEKFLSGIIFITLMKISIITNSIILNAYRQESICVGIMPPELQNSIQNSGNGGNQKLAGVFCERMPEKCMNELRDVNLRVRIVGFLLKLDILDKFIAQANAPLSWVRHKLPKLAKYVESCFGQENIRPRKFKHAPILAVGRCDDLKPVYNLTVADAHLFYANGILSSNTESEDHAPDEIRYACMSRPYIKDIQKAAKGRILGVGPHSEVRLEDLWEKPNPQRRARV